MRTLLLAGACIVLISGPALACRGTAEYPQAFNQLEQSNIPSVRMKELIEQLTQGQSLHEEGHRQGDMDKMGKSLRMLDGIKGEIGM